MVVMDQYTRRIVGFAVHAGNVDGPALCRMFNDSTSEQGWPKHLSSDNDPLFQYHRCHTSRDGVTPVMSGASIVVDIDHYRWEKHCRSFFQLPLAA
jgi:hypothetical protein